MPSRTSPTLRRRRLAAEMRRLRAESGKNRDQVAHEATIASATIHRIETAAHAPSPAHILMLCKVYGVSEERTEFLVTLARQSRLKGWWHRYSGAIPSWFQVYVGIEEEASSIRIYQSEVVPGLVQTEAYARATYAAEPIVPPDDEIDRHVAVRLGRLKQLLEVGDPPEIWLVLSEAALRRRVGGAETMREQLQHLIKISRLPTVTLQVLPYEAGAHPATMGAFHILGFPEPADPDVVYLEYRTGSLYLEDAEEIKSYTLMFDHLRVQALGRNESRALIKRVIDDLN
ncbi:MAG TPA: helix-turn-helix transcriptional regulator [Streptosporangiaceae bacterium]